MRLSLVALGLASLTLTGCGGDSVPLGNTVNGSLDDARRLMFVVSGGCYGGGVALSTGSSTIVALDMTTGSLHHIVRDYSQLSPGDTPVEVQEFDEDHILALVENTGGRRFELVRKDGADGQTFLTNTTALSAVMRFFKLLTDGSILVSKSSAIEKFGANKARVTQGANPWINAPAGACATSTTLISSLDVFPSTGKIIYTHAAATPNNKFALISATGYAAAGDCLAASAGPTTTALPTSVIIHPGGKTLVAYGSTTTASNLIYSYDVNDAANTIGGATSAYSDAAVVNGASAMAVDDSTGLVYVASALSTFNTIEEFQLSGATLARTRSLPFAGPTFYTRCVSSMAIMDYTP